MPASPSPPTVFVVDDDESTRKSVNALTSAVGLRCLTFASAEEYLQAEHSRRPGCLVLDLVLDGLSGVQLLEKLAASPTPIPVVVISAYADVPTVVQCMEYGAVTLLEKPCEDKALVDAIERAITFDREQQRLKDRLQQLQSSEQVLVEREREVLNRVIDGRLNKKIARELNVSERTVENVRSRVMQKFDADNATELAAKYTELQLLRNLAHRISPLRGPNFIGSAQANAV